MKFVSLLLLLLALMMVPSSAAQAAETRPWLEKLSDSSSARAIKILFIGHSKFFINDMPKMFNYMVQQKTSNVPLKIYSVCGDSFSLQRQWQSNLARQAIINYGPWNYVVLLETSGLPEANPRQFAESVLQFDREIKKAGAKTVLVENYVDDPRDYARCHQVMTTIANKYGTYLLPIATAWNTARRKHPSIEIFDPDGHHPNTRGTYLMSCVCYALFLGQDPRNLPEDFYRINDNGETVSIFDKANDSRPLQEAAFDAVRNMRR